MSCNDYRKNLCFIQHYEVIKAKDLSIKHHEPTSDLLNYCKEKFLRPYVGILSVVGLNPIATDTTLYRALLSYIQAIIVFVFLVFGYIVRYLCDYRVDRGFNGYQNVPSTILGDVKLYNNNSNAIAVHTVGDLLFGYVIPSTLNMFGFVSAVVLYKIIDHEQLQNLIERVFLISANPKQLCRMLWIYIALGFTLLIIHFAYACCAVLMQPSHTSIININWIAYALNNWEICMKLMLLLTIFVQDLVEIVILMGYYIQCYLLRVHLETLSYKLHVHTIDSLDWMRQVLEFRKLLKRLNHRVAVPVCFLIIINLVYAFAGVVHLFQEFDSTNYWALKFVILNVIHILLWLILGLLPFFVAASVTRACQSAQVNGHRIRVKPYVYQKTTNEDLNSTLLFASSMVMSAKLFRMPIQSNYLCFAIVVVAIVILTMGMCFKFST